MAKSTKEIKERVEKLRELLRHHSHLYHVKDSPEISDEAYDSLFEELVEIEKEFPELKTPTSPTSRIGDEPLDEFSKIEHEHRQWSFDNAFSKKELEKWEEKIVRILEKKNIKERPTYSTELKIDGLKIVLTYEKGTLQTAATRGNGRIGEDVTVQAKTISSIPLVLNREVDVVCVGEVWLSEGELERINKERAKNGEAVFVNARNAAAGSMRQLDPKITAKRRLDTFVYDLEEVNGDGLSHPETQIGELELLGDLGFKVNTNYICAKSIDEVQDFYDKWISKKEKQNYGVDGLVLKVNSVALQKELGYTASAPRFGVAYKFPAEQATTVIEEIALQVGRTGVLTPVAHLKPVSVGGATVSRVTLHNEDFINELDIRIGDTVIIQRAGDVIPEVVEVVKKLRTGKEKKFSFPKKVPECGGDGLIERVPGQAAFRCVNKDSFAQKERIFEHFVSKKAFDIDGLGKEQVRVFLEESLVSDLADIFTLQKGDLLSLPRFAEKSVDNLLNAIDDAREVSLARFLVGLSIDQVGEETAHDLAEHFGSLDKIQNADIEELSQIEGVGEVVASAVCEWFRDKDNKELIRKLVREVEVKNPKTKKASRNSKVSGKSFVLTGTLEEMSREEAKENLRALDASVSSSVSSKTDYLVAGESPGSKFDKAKDLGVKILSEEEFLKLIDEK